MTSAPQPTTARRFAVFSGNADVVAHTTPAWHGTAGEPQTGVSMIHLLKHRAGTICSRSLMVKPVIYNRQSIGSSPIASTNFNLSAWRNVDAGTGSGPHRKRLASESVLAGSTPAALIHFEPNTGSAIVFGGGRTERSTAQRGVRHDCGDT